MPRWALMLGLALLLQTGEASGRGWPRPAAGHSQSGGPEVIFTFDDGPHGRYTGMILDALADHGVKAIFYWVGHRLRPGRAFREKRLAMVERAVAEGHLVATHTINHVHLCHLPPAEAAHEIDGARTLYERLTGLPMLLFRAPYGDRCRRLLAMLKERHLRNMQWDIDPHEWENHDSAATAQRVIEKLAHLKGRAVVLMHDTKRVTAEALPRILDWIDQENARRRESGRTPIKILSGSELVAEQCELGLAHWFLHASADAGEEFEDAIGRLIPGHRHQARITVGRR